MYFLLQVTPDTTRQQTISRNSDLDQLTSALSQQLPTCDTVMTSQDAVKVAMAKTVILVGKVLLERRAMLLPAIHDQFSSYATELIDSKT